MIRTSHIANTLACAGAILLLVTSGCAVGPDFKHPTAPTVKDYTDSALPAQTTSTGVIGGNAQTFASDKDVAADWWKLFGSDPLNQLIEQALKANPDLQAAQASLRQARENLYARQGALLPAVDLDLSPTREKFSPSSFGQVGAPSELFTLYNASVSVSYVLDVFGGERREIEAYRAQADLQHYELEATYLTLTSNVVTAALQEASLREQIKETQHIVDIEHEELDVLNKQFELGGVAKSAVLAQQALVAQSEAALPPLEKQLAQKRNQLAALSGHFPNEKLDATFELDGLHLPEELPVSLPSKLVEQRPDIKASEAALHTASAEIGVATANMLPQFTITGSYGSETTQFDKLFTPSAEVWSLGAGLLQPIFHGGTLLHERRAAQAGYDKASAQYRSTVLAAFQNVADTLRALQFDADALQAQANAEHAASDSLSLAREQYKDGAISYPQMLDAERSYSQTRIALVQAQALRFADTAALFQALGGGWWNRTKTPEQHAQTLSSTEPKP